ncbi:MAG: restriction endonuclease subunit S [Deltaproteobacteria bacterium]|nr:restriction endonuclease subunit S [Deltaproteobacteria bacterium]
MTRKAEPSGGGDLPRGWRWVALGEVCEINPRRPGEFVRGDEEETSFVPMEAVDARRGKVDRLRSRSYAEVKKGYTYFADGDVLFAKITPCMQNGKHFVAEGLIGGVGFASTEFHVLRHGDAIHAKWVHFYLTQPAILRKATYYFTGSAGQRRVPGSFLKGLKIPLPPIVEQAKILEILENEMGAVEKARRAALDRVEAARALDSAFLREALEFGDEKLPPGWRWRALGEVCLEDRRGIDGASSEAAELPYLSLENVESMSGKIVMEHNSNSRGISNCFRFGSDHILYGKLRPYLNKVALPNFHGRCTTELIPLLPKQNIHREFLALLLRQPKTVDWVMREKTGSRMPRANMKRLMKLEFPLPPLAEQKQIAAALNAKMAIAKQTHAAAEAELEAIEALPGALLRRAFRATP